jgi:hypothetical protein
MTAISPLPARLREWKKSLQKIEGKERTIDKFVFHFLKMR